MFGYIFCFSYAIVTHCFAAYILPITSIVTIHVIVVGGQKLTGQHPGFDISNPAIGDVFLDMCRFTGLFQQVPNINAAVLFANEENSWSGQGPACCSAHLLRVW